MLQTHGFQQLTEILYTKFQPKWEYRNICSIKLIRYSKEEIVSLNRCKEPNPR